MKRLHFAWLAVLAAITLAFAGCDAITGGDDSSGAPSVKDGTEYIVVDDSSSGALTNGAITLGANDVVVRIDAAGDGKWVAEDADGKAVFWGTAEVLPSGFYYMKVTGSKVDDPAKGTEVIGLEVSAGVLFIMGVESFDATEQAFLDEDTVGINVDGSCPSDGTANYNFIAFLDSQSDAQDGEIGVANLVTAGGSTDVDVAGVTLDTDVTSLVGTESFQLGGFSCEGGFAENADGDSIIFPGAGFAIIEDALGGGAVALPRPSTSPVTINNASAAGVTYAGVTQTYTAFDGTGTARMSALAVEGQGSGMLYGANYTSVANIQSGTVDVDPATNSEAATITLGNGGGVNNWFDTTTIDVSTGNFPLMVMTLPDGRFLVIGMLWGDDGSSAGVLEAGESWELIILVQQ